MISEQLLPLFDFSIATHLLAASLLALVATMLFSRNTENFAGKKFRAFIVFSAIAQLILFCAKSKWIGYQVTFLCNSVVLLSIATTLDSIARSASNAQNPLKLWSKLLTLLAGISTLLWVGILVAGATGVLPEVFSESVHLFFIGHLLVLLGALLFSEYLFRNAEADSKVVSRPFFFAIWLWMIAELFSTGYIISTGKFGALTHFLSGYYGLAIAFICLVGSSRSSFEQRFRLASDSTFYGASLKASSIVLIGMAILGFLVSQSDFRLTDSIQLLFALGWLIGITLLIFSSKRRSKLRVFINKNLFANKYNYRNIWLTLIDRLSSPNQSDSFYETSLGALGEIFNAEGGALWVKRPNNQLELVEHKNIRLDAATSYSFDASAPFVEAMQEQNWVYTISGTSSSAATNPNRLLPTAITALPNAWIAGPLQISGELVGFFLLLKSKADDSMVWEDLDIAKSAGSQIASYIVRQQSAEKLAEAKQFDTYNQLTAFIMHDLKNLIAQQALVVKNASKHKENPAFVEDMIQTIDNSVQRMNGLLNRLKRNDSAPDRRTVDLKQLLLDAIRKSTDRQPIPTLRTQDFQLGIQTSVEQMTMVITHLIRNAQDATDNDGFIDIDVVAKPDNSAPKFVEISIEDNGSGMSDDFLKNRLFKPFESTKSSMGMGIGAFQARDFVRNMGGDIQVTSEENVGTTVSISLPVA